LLTCFDYLLNDNFRNDLHNPCDVEGFLIASNLALNEDP
jgi:hypothetical protein